ncbi:MAG: PFL family protein, partial [Coriobacteriia bacterium]|nr:PFL family protein [Coriobacteriia bacterium]
PGALASTERVCSSVNVASTRAGINMDAIARMAHVVKETAALTAERDSIGCAKLVVFANMVEDNPFMAGAMHGPGEADVVVNVGISGPGVVRAVIAAMPPEADLTAVAEAIKATSFKITRAGELVAREAARRLGVAMGIVDLSLAPTPAEGDSVADILEAMGVERCGAPGTTTALALLNDAVKKGGAMGTSSIGGLSGAFIPVSEDAGMVRAVQDGALNLEKLEAMTAVCSVGLDMIAIPGDTPAETIAGIISDACAIGVINNKTTAARLIPVVGKTVGDHVSWGGLLGAAPVMSVSEWSSAGLVRRGGRVPAPLGSLRN